MSYPVPPQDRALREQQQAERILAVVERVEHFLYLRKKFGPRGREVQR